MTTTDEEQDSVPMYKLALIGDSGEARRLATAYRYSSHWAASRTPLHSRPAGVGKTCILLRFAEGGFNVSFMSTVGCVAALRRTRALSRPSHVCAITERLCV